MSTRARTDEKTVTLLRPGVGAEEYVLPANATLADLLRAADASTKGQDVFIEKQPLNELIMLRPGVTVTVVPRVKNAAEAPAWSKGVGRFRDDPAFEEMMRRVEAARKLDEAQE